MEKLPLSIIIIGLVGVVGLISTIAAGVAGIVVGLPVFVVATAAAYFVIDSSIGRPMRKIAALSSKMDEALEGNTSTMPLPVTIHMGAELHQLTLGLQQASDVFGRRLAELDTLHAISQTITSSTLDYEKTVKSVLAAVQKVVDYDAAEVSIIKGRSLVVEAWWGKEGFTDTTGRKYKVGSGPTGTIAASKEPLFLPTVKETEGLKRTIGIASVETELISKTTKLVISSFLGIPLLIGDKLIGTLTLVHHEANFFTEDDMRQLNKLADHASIAIDNALQVREREEALKNQIQELRIEIDKSKVSEQIEEVTSSDFFRHLQSNAAKMREQHASRSQQRKADDPESDDTEKTPSNENDSSENS